MIGWLQLEQRVCLHLPERIPAAVSRCCTDLFGGGDVVVDPSEAAIAETRPNVLVAGDHPQVGWLIMDRRCRLPHLVEGWIRIPEEVAVVEIYQ